MGKKYINKCIKKEESHLFFFYTDNLLNAYIFLKEKVIFDIIIDEIKEDDMKCQQQ